MRTSDTQTELIKALFAARRAFPTINKNKSGQAGNRQFKYAPLEEIQAACEPGLEANGLMITQPPDDYNVITRLEHISGEWRESRMPLNTEHANNQSFGIEITYRRRYSYQMMLGIVTEEDTDGAGGQKRKGRDNTRNANGTAQGVFISPTAEIANEFALSAEPARIAELDDLALDLIESFKNGRQIEAVKGYYAIPDNEEKTYVWNQLKTESKLRSFLKANSPHKQKVEA